MVVTPDEDEFKYQTEGENSWLAGLESDRARRVDWRQTRGITGFI